MKKDLFFSQKVCIFAKILSQKYRIFATKINIKTNGKY